jgi:hypothetical protein
MPDAHPTAADQSVEFTDRDVRLIILSLAGQIDARGRELLPMVLREWAATDLQEHLAREPKESIAQRIEHLESIARAYADAADLLESLDERGLIGLKLTMTNSPGAVASEGERFDEASGVIQREPDRLRQIAVAARGASKIWRRARGRPRNLVGNWILLDLAEIYEWLVGQEASRRTNREEGVDTGPFWDFASAVWPIVFGSDDGLSHGLKSWASYRKKYAPSLPLINNMDRRHPEWRLFDD